MATKRAVKTFWQSLWDAVGIPFRLALFDQAWLPHWGWTTLETERIQRVLPWVNGFLLDVGAGPNRLVREYGEGVGVDVYPWGGGAWLIRDAAQLPFKPASFGTIAFLACLNHIPNRAEALREARRIIRSDGRVILTMIDPILGGIGHRIWWYSEDKHRGGMAEGEVGGMWNRDILSLMREAGFEIVHLERFVYGLNNLLVFRPV